MAEEALIQAATKRGIAIKVETHGQVGVENGLTREDIRRATGVIVAADKDVQAERFAGKPLVDVGVSQAIHDPDALIDKVLARAKEGITSTADDDTDAMDHDMFATNDDGTATGGKKVGRAIYKHLMNGVSNMLPFVVGGGVLIAMSFLWGIYSADPESEQYNALAASLKTIGGAGLGLMVPVLSAYIAESIAKRPGLVIGFITGMIAMQNGTGFLGGIVTGFLSGFGMIALAKALEWMPKSLNGLKAIFLFPVLGAAIFGLITVVISQPMAAISTSMQDFLSGFQDANPIVLGIILGCMCAFDMGGPVNKAAYVTGVALLADGNYQFMAAVSAACMVPPIVIAIACTIFPRSFEPGERRAGWVNYILGATHITEGAIPFAAKNPLVVLPILMLSSSIGAILSLLWHCGSPAPHGGFLVLPIIENPFGWVAAIFIGALVGGLLYGAYMTRRMHRLQGEKTAQPSPSRTHSGTPAPVAVGSAASATPNRPDNGGQHRKTESPSAVLQTAAQPSADSGDVPLIVDTTITAADRDSVLREISQLAALGGHITSADAIMAGMVERETQITTAQTDLIAIPHTKNAAVNHPVIVVVRTPEPVSWTGDKPVRVAVGMLTPDSGGNTHLKLLAKLARGLVKSDLRTILLNGSEEDIRSAIHKQLGD